VPTMQRVGPNLISGCETLMVRVRLYRRVPLVPGLVYLNVSRSMISLSIGRRGVGVTFGQHGVRFSAGIVGSGISLSKRLSYSQISLSKQCSVDSKKNNHSDRFVGESRGPEEI